ncbi:PAS domain-containing sensor histidine kinase [Sulfitobacter sp. S0837]|uniref:sensor histidine kinase n=2 Tax=Sulfitobacter maritimus TaxID=2741719 RepID=UPI00158254FB|nr:PAS domain-containing sensor histidine kinase [Sulfitobacter maritimus]NUH66353.1 PAS domain-containing sensor histidine kinase [Sulfitobacter maritimus]
MRPLGRPGLALILPLIAIFVFAVLLAFALNRMVRVADDIRVNAEHNMLWVMHQSEIAARRLVETTLRAELGEADAAEIALRLDLLRSRFALLHEGPQRRFMEEIGMREQLSTLNQTLQSIAPPSAPISPSTAQDLREALAPFTRFFSRAANKTMIREWDDLGGRLETARAQLRQIIASLFGITVTGAVLILTLFFALRLSRQRTNMLRRERDFSALLVSSSGDGILAIDAAGRCTIWNDAMATMTGQPAERAVGRKLSDITGFFGTAHVQTALKASLAGKDRSIALQPYYRDAEEPALYVDLRFSPMLDEGRVVGAIVFMHDASDRYAARQRAAQTRGHLEQLVAERTRELDEALLRERSAADLYRNFAGMISHQFRTPLAVADSALQRLIRRGGRASTAEIVDRARGARDAIAGLTRLVASTMDATRLQTGQVGARRVACDLSNLLEGVRARQQAMAPEARIETDHPANLNAVALCDPAHAEQVLENLMSNAVKYAPKGSAITVHLHGNATKLHCDVTNDGPKIAEADRAQLFDANFRGQNSIGTRGTGVGLFIARSLARMQGGDLQLRDTDRGTSFRFTLPRYEGEK